MKFLNKYTLILLFFSGNFFLSYSQQLPQYAQFTLNNLSVNPAYGGSHLGLEFWAGRRNQWIGFDLAPVQTYVSGSYAFRKNFNYKAVHCVGAYVEQDKAGLFINKSAHVFYSINLKVSKAFKISFGLFAGYRSVGIASNILDVNDPALTYTKPVIALYPDFVPGYRIYSKKMFFDISVRNLYKNKLKQGSQSIGKNSKLVAQPTIIFGYRFHSPTNDFVFTPAIKLQSAVTQPPLVDLNFIAYYKRRIGLGITYRPNSSAAVMLQLRVRSNIMLGFAYEYPIGRLRYAQPNTLEVMMGFSPVMGTDTESPRSNNVAACPAFDY
ncbi:MAG: PorP/SprF family type IX secretion system membrane protein [Bacteroidia bacterium]|nr:PorP/SprF family type IX secretion system membrane protein [Bacteroidia bacterium]